MLEKHKLKIGKLMFSILLGGIVNWGIRYVGLAGQVIKRGRGQQLLEVIMEFQTGFVEFLSIFLSANEA